VKLKDKNNLKNSATTNDLNLKSVNQQHQKSNKDDNNLFVLNPINKFTKSASGSSIGTSSSVKSPSLAYGNKNNNKHNASNDKPKKSTNTSSNDLKNSTSFATHKKFSIGSYVHLLNEDQDENQDDDWDDEDEKKVEKYNDKKSTASFNNNIERIAQKINSTARTKWKNSNNVEPTNGASQKSGPQHIRFESSSSDSESSSSDSSDSSSTTSINSTSLKNKVLTKKPVNDQVKAQNNNKAKAPQQNQKKNWKPLNKEEQTNMISYNRSFVIQVKFVQKHFLYVLF